MSETQHRHLFCDWYSSSHSVSAQTKSFALWCWPWCFINYFRIISIWSRLLFGITQNHGRDRFSISFAKSTTFWIQRRRSLGLQYITIVRTVIFKTTIFWKLYFCELWRQLDSTSRTILATIYVHSWAPQKYWDGDYPRSW